MATRFSYYDRLSAADKRIYRKSDRVTEVRLRDPRRLEPLVSELDVALATSDRTKVERAARRLCRGVTEMLGIEPVTVRVLSRRPRNHDGELHGLYTWEEGRPGVIEVWMRTAEHRRVVAFRTFLRTLLHELCHHLDYALLEFSETFHTDGFFRRESSLMRQLVGEARGRKPPGALKQEASEAKPPTPRRQLSLFE